MLGLLTLTVFSSIAFTVIKHQKRPTTREVALPPKTNKKLKQLWSITNKAIKGKKYLAAEKALISILKIDHKNSAAYNRLGIVYAKQKNLEDAQECFEIASTLAPSPSNLHNLGLIYYELRKYEKAAIAFERAIDLEPSTSRYIAYAKSFQKMNNMRQVIDTLEKALNHEEHPEVLSMLSEAYIIIGNDRAALEARSRLEEGSANDNQTDTDKPNISPKKQVRHRASSV